MPHLADLLSLLYTAHQNVSSIYVEAREATSSGAERVLVADAYATGGVRLHWMGHGSNGEDSLARRRRIWFVPPNQIRVEVTAGQDAVVRAAVQNGASWWRWDPDEGETAGDLRRGSTLPPILVVPLLRPQSLLGSTILEVAGAGRRLGRDVLIARGAPRQDGVAAEKSTDLEFDMEHGTPLYIAQRRRGHVSSVTEVVDIEYAPRLDPDLFSFRRHGGAEGDMTRSRRQATVHQQTRRRPMPGLMPRQLTCGTVWLTGLPGAGKTTLAKLMEGILHQLGSACCVIDGDELRRGLSSDLGMSEEDRHEQGRRAAFLAATVAESGVIAIVALVSPYAEDRERARQIHEDRGLPFFEVWVDTPTETCASRDKKGLYSSASGDPRVALAGYPDDGSGLTGVNAPYEAPAKPDLRVQGHGQHPRVAAETIIATVLAPRRVGGSTVVGITLQDAATPSAVQSDELAGGVGALVTSAALNDDVAG